MSHQRQRSFAMSLLLTGLLVTLMSFGGGWGEAYGQTAGPTPTPRRAALSITKEIDNARPQPGETVVFTIRVQNIGDIPATEVVVEDNMPSSLEVLEATSSTGTVTVSGPLVTVEIGQLDPGAIVIITIRARVRPDAQGRLVNSVTVRHSNLALGQERAQATLDVSDSVDDDQPGGPNNGGQPGGPGNGQPALPTATPQGPRGSLGNTGADSSMQWWLLVLGLMLIAAGSAIYWRARATR